MGEFRERGERGRGEGGRKGGREGVEAELTTSMVSFDSIGSSISLSVSMEAKIVSNLSHLYLCALSKLRSHLTNQRASSPSSLLGQPR